MILTFLLNALYLVLSSSASILPASTGLPSEITTAFQFVVYQLNTLSFIFPVQTLFVILGYTLLIEAAYFGFEGSLWVYHKIRGI